MRKTILLLIITMMILAGCAGGPSVKVEKGRDYLEDSKMYLVSEEQGFKSKLTQKSDVSLCDTTVGATLTIIEGSSTSLTFEQNGFTTTINKITSEI